MLLVGESCDFWIENFGSDNRDVEKDPHKGKGRGREEIMSGK